MTNTPILSNPDFNSLKLGIKNHLKSQTRFKDYNFEGSNMSVLIEELAYSAYQSGFTTNMLASESFLDSAVLRTSAIKKAKELGYTPRSIKSSVAYINISFSSPQDVVTIPLGSIFSSFVNNTNFNFVTTKEYIINKNKNTDSFSADLEILEGDLISEYFTIGTDNNIILSLSNSDIDTSTFKVLNSTTNEEYIHYDSILDLDENTCAFFIQYDLNENPQIYFGDGIMGKKPNVNDIFKVDYIKTSGALANDCAIFYENYIGNDVNELVITTLEPASGGDAEETIDSIKFNAPLVYQSRKRAVTENDYKFIIKNSFPRISDVAVFGGEDANPPQFGSVILSLITGNGVLSKRFKQEISDYIKSKNINTISIDFIDPEIIYLGLNVTIKLNKGDLNDGNIKSSVYNAIIEYENKYINKFNGSLQYSTLLTTIDNSNTKILHNDTKIFSIMYLDVAQLNSSGITINFNNALDPQSFESDVFVYNNTNCIMADDGNGNINIQYLKDANYQFVKKVGTINYTTGELVLNSVGSLSSVSNLINVKVDFANNDLICKNNTVLKFDKSNINITLAKEY